MVINVFKRQIYDGIVHPDDQPMLDKYIIDCGVAASSIRPKRDGVHIVTLKSGRKVLAKWRGKMALEMHSDINLIKQTTSRGNVRYYMYLSETDGPKVVSASHLYSKITRILETGISDEALNEILNDCAGLDEITTMLQAMVTNQPSERVQRIISKIVRNRKIAQWVKERQKYICEVCKREPFIQTNGRPYAEADHIKPLGLDGLDTPGNIRCLCSQCHAVITHGSEETVKDLLSSGR